MKKTLGKLALARDTVRNLNSGPLSHVRGGQRNVSEPTSGNPPCLTSDGACPSGAQSCNPADCTISLSG